jgi:hypothetical protein
MEDAKTNRNHKNSVFTKLFGEKSNLLELYNAVSGKNYPENTEIEIITLSDVLYMEQLNDIAFVIDNRLVVLIEHQSTVNENMPLRMLIYISREYEKITTSKNLYKEKMIKIPTPEFIVLYNGKKEFPDFMEMKLSDLFELKTELCSLELVVKAYNINKGRNVDMANRSPMLDGYETFIAEINENLKTMGLPAAIKVAIASCISKGILVYFLKENGSEVENMLLTGWNMKDALAVAREEGTEDGIEIGMENGIGIGVEKGRAEEKAEILSLIKQGYSLTDIENMLKAQLGG